MPILHISHSRLASYLNNCSTRQIKLIFPLAAPEWPQHKNINAGCLLFKVFNKKQVDRYRNFRKGTYVTGFKNQYQYIVVLICTDVKIRLKFLCDEVIAGETVFNSLIFKEV